MRKFLLTTTAIVALSAQINLSRAADIDAVGHVDDPTAFISFEGGFLFNSSPDNAGFADDDAKLGNLGSLQPGGDAWQGRVEFGQRLNEKWDFKVGLSAISTGTDTTQGSGIGLDSEFDELEEQLRDILEGIINNPGNDIAGIEFGQDSRAEQKTSLQIADLEFGYHPAGTGLVETRLFAGVRGLHSKTELEFETDAGLIIITDEGDEVNLGSDVIKSGDISDTVYAIGPRIGADLAIPLESADAALVGSASGSLLFGSVSSESSSSFDFNDAQTIWNVEAMAGVSFGIGERADLTLGYRAAQFGELMIDRSDIDKTGDFSNPGQSDLLLHGPFARLTVEIP